MTTELLTDPGHIRQDLAMIEKRIRDELKSREVKPFKIADIGYDNLAQIVLATAKEGATPRTKHQAAKTLLAIADYNLRLAEFNAKQNPQPPIEHEHHHTHDIGPVTESNIEAQRAKRLARLAGTM